MCSSMTPERPRSGFQRVVLRLQQQVQEATMYQRSGPPQFGQRNMPSFGAASSPMGGSYPSPMGAAIRHSSDQMCSALSHGSWDRKEWIIEKNVPKTLTQFSGRIETYSTWYDRVRDHLICSHEGWGRILDLLERGNDTP